MPTFEVRRGIQTEQEVEIEWASTLDCLRIREKLDGLFSGQFFLETTLEQTKRKLFRHLETCEQCCRSFDARMVYRSTRRTTGIY